MKALNSSCVIKVAYAPTIINSPWAILITPMRPKTMANPTDMISKMELRLIPRNSVSIAVDQAAHVSMRSNEARAALRELVEIQLRPQRFLPSRALARQERHFGSPSPRAYPPQRAWQPDHHRPASAMPRFPASCSAPICWVLLRLPGQATESPPIFQMSPDLLQRSDDCPPRGSPILPDS